MKDYDIYIEGFAATGNRGVAHLLGTARADNFTKAVIQFNWDNNQDDRYGYFSPSNLSFWGCRCFQTLEEAQRSFG